MSTAQGPASDGPVRVVIADDHEVVRRGVRWLLDNARAPGYKVVADPTKDTQGIWYADAANADGRNVKLMVDYQGNVFEKSRPNAPISGKTNLTSDAARTSMEKRGYNVLSNPIKDDNGIWYAEGAKTDGQTA